jgi:CRISPR system Cascade subunit CasB
MNEITAEYKTGEKQRKEESFVEYIIHRCQSDNGIAASLRRADNPATEYQCWEVLAGFHIDLDKEWVRLPYAAIAAAIAKAKIDRNGHNGIGKAIAACYEDGSNSDQAKAKLRRLFACQSVEEACRILRPLLGLIESRGVTLDYARLLQQLLAFHWENRKQQIRSQWAQDFYGRQEHDAGGAE